MARSYICQMPRRYGKSVVTMDRVFDFDTKGFVNAFRKMSEAFESFANATNRAHNRLIHHTKEDPKLSAMHTAYDRRRRARRRRK